MTERPRLALKSGTLIVLEGPDDCGKSTQLKLMRDSGLWAEGTLFTHQPSGGSDIGQAIYQLTEENQDIPPRSRQFLHLAAHCMQYEQQLLPHVAAGGSVIMDRCWWSAVAYGWGCNPEIQAEMDFGSYVRMVQHPTQGLLPDLVLVFPYTWGEVPADPQLLDAYQLLINSPHVGPGVVIPQTDTAQTTEDICMAIEDAGLLQ